MPSRLPVCLVALLVTVSGGCGLLERGPEAEVGDCLDLTALDGEVVTQIPTVDCAQEHNGQVAATFEMPDGAYPGEKQIQEAIEDRCLTGSESFVGTGGADSTLQLSDLSPTEDSWAGGDRRVLCLVYMQDGATTETFEGSGLLGQEPAVEVGDCVEISALQGEEINDVPTVDCAQEHDGQVAVSHQMPDGDYPSEQEWQDVIGDMCVSGFEAFVGTAYEDSTLEIYDLSPTEDSWDAGDRQVLCLVYLEDDTTTQSFEDSGL